MDFNFREGSVEEWDSDVPVPPRLRPSEEEEKYSGGRTGREEECGRLFFQILLERKSGMRKTHRNGVASFALVGLLSSIVTVATCIGVYDYVIRDDGIAGNGGNESDSRLFR